MRPAPDHYASVVAWRQLAGRQRPTDEQIAQAVDAIQSLGTGTRSWKAFPPKRDALDAAIRQADAIARALRQLREDLNQ